jgi:pentatricopeptide repeat protein
MYIYIATSKFYFVHDYCHKGLGRLAEDVLLMMINKGIQPSDKIANDFLICYERMAKVHI